MAKAGEHKQIGILFTGAQAEMHGPQQCQMPEQHRF